MKIIIVGTAYPYRGGLAAFNERLAREFSIQGNEVQVQTFTLQYPAFLFPGKTQYSNQNPQSDLNIRRTLNTVNPFNWKKVAGDIVKEKPDMVIFCYWMFLVAPAYGLISRIIKRKSNIVTIGLVHNLISHGKSFLDKLLAPFFVKSMDGFVTLSDSVSKDIEKIASALQPVVNTPHPMYDHYGEAMDRETACRELSLDASYRYLLFFGFVREYKGLDLLLEAMGDERLKAKNIKLIVAGEFYDAPEMYLNQIERLGIKEQIICIDTYISDEDVKKYFSASDMVVQPYKSATQSGVTQIAYYFEKPMLVTNVGGLPEIVPHEKAGYVVDCDPKKISAALNDFFEKDRGAAMSIFVKNEKFKYTWKTLIEKFMLLYGKIRANR